MSDVRVLRQVQPGHMLLFIGVLPAVIHTDQPGRFITSSRSQHRPNSRIQLLRLMYLDHRCVQVDRPGDDIHQLRNLMRPCPFKYIAPPSVAEICTELSRHGTDAKIIAGGQSLAPLLNMRLVQPRVLVDIGRADELRYIRRADDVLVVGAGTSQRDLECATELRAMPVLRTLLQHVGYVTTRNRGTVGGSIAHGDPAAELPLALVTLGGSVVVRSATGAREIASRDLFQGLFSTALRADELLSEIRFPITPRTAVAHFEELTLRATGESAIVAVLATVELRQGRCHRVQIGIGGVAETPVLVSPPAAELLIGSVPTAALLDSAARACTSALRPVDDLRASATYKRRMAQTLVRRVLERACAELEEERSHEYA